MPEIWLKYGSTDVVLDIRFENLANHVTSNLQPISDEQVKTALDDVPVTDGMLVLALSSSKAAAKAINVLVETARAKGFSNMTVDAPSRVAGSLRANLVASGPDPQNQIISINRIDYQSLSERLTRFQSTIIISQLAYDPLFGFSGAPTSILRNLQRDKMAEAFAARQGNVPTPGIEGEPLKIALGAVENLQATSVELIAAGTGIAGVHSGTIADAFSQALAQFKTSTEVQVNPVKSAIISASSEHVAHSTLSDSLNSLWNCSHVVSEGGTAVLLAECRDGLGGGALQAYIEDRLADEHIATAQYSEGLEHLLYLQELKQKKEIGLVSTLPHYYAKKLGFMAFDGARSTLENLLVKHGKSHKTLVIGDADVTLLRTAA